MRAGDVTSILDPGLGNTSYLADLGGGLAASVDPPRDVDSHLEAADRAGLRIVAVLETHLHADFVSGARELVEAVGAEVHASAGAELGFPHLASSEGRPIRLGDAEIRALATPGHTPEHVSWVLAAEERIEGVFTGGSMIAGGAARTDLIDPALTEDLARAQFRSFRRLGELPDATALYPTHGAGSFCSSGPTGNGTVTLGGQRVDNPLLGIDDEDEFVRRLLAGYGSFPPYFLRLRDVNRRPPLVRELLPPRPLDAEGAREAVGRGAWLVDARSTHEWAAAHPRGAVSIELRPVFASWLGWVVPFGAPVVLLVSEEHRDEAIRQARRIGYDAVLGWIDGGVDAWHRAGLPLASVDEVTPEEAARRLDAGTRLVDVRQRSEIPASRIPGSVAVELGDIIAGRGPDTGDVIVYCGHGERSATAASLLVARGVRVANLLGGLQGWQGAGFPVETG